VQLTLFQDADSRQKPAVRASAILERLVL